MARLQSHDFQKQIDTNFVFEVCAKKSLDFQHTVFKSADAESRILRFIFQNEYHERHPQSRSPAKIHDVISYINYCVQLTVVAILCYIYRVSF